MSKFQTICHSDLDSKEDVWVLSLAEAVEEEREVVVVVQRLQGHLHHHIVTIATTTIPVLTFQEILFPLPSCFREMGKSPRS